MESVLACPACGQPARPENRFCRFCAAPLRKSCPSCGQETTIWARFCPNCRYAFALPGAPQEEREERQVVGFGLPEGTPTPTVPGVSAASQTGAPPVSTAPAGPQAGAPTISSAPAGPQSGAPRVQSAPAGPQSGAPAVQSAPPPSQPGMPGVFSGHPGYQTGMVGRAVGKTTARELGSRVLSTAAGKVIAAVVAAVIVVTSGTAIAAATGHNPLSLLLHNNSTTTRSNAAPLPPPEVTYIGSDGNVWDMTLPGGKPKQLTTDAVIRNPDTGTAGIAYGGLAWSPDGKELAVERSVSTGGSNELLLLKPDGKIISRFPSVGGVIWSPDGRFLAYRAEQGLYNFPGGNPGDVGVKLVIVDARTGATTNSFTYNAGQIGECGAGAGFSLYGVMYAAHHTYFGVDTFVWSPDGKEILVAFDCGGPEAHVIALSNGNVTPGYPAGADFQPGGHLILGLSGLMSSNESLELTDLAGKQARVLASSNDQQGNSPYIEGVGPGTWSGDGKTIYYEYQDDIWRVNVDGSGAKQVVAGTQLSGNQATIELAPSLSPDDKWLLYLKASGSVDYNDNNAMATGQWYVAQPDGSGAVALPQATVSAQGYSLFQPPSVEAAWRP